MFEAKTRDNRIDALKGLAIIAIVVYHLGMNILPFGYLGVEIFLVISGYLFMKGFLKSEQSNGFHYFNFILKKLVRLWPLVLIVVLFSLIPGFFVMIPDDFENLGQSVVAGSTFTTNILSSITTKNYWNTANLFKPLMHTWYIGILMQAYVLFPIILFIVNKTTRYQSKYTKWAVIVFGVLSFILYCLPCFSEGNKFYLLPFRFFELAAGMVIAFLPPKERRKSNIYTIGAFLYTLLLILLCTYKGNLLNAQFKLLLTVFLTALVLFIIHNTVYTKRKLIDAFAAIGKRSLSIYLWHQVFIAYMYYALVEKLTIPAACILFLTIGIISAFSYRFIEIPLSTITSKGKTFTVLLSTFAMCIALIATGFIIYLKAGVIRNVPELGITTDNIQRGMHAAYCDIPYSWDRDFTDSQKTKILVVGNSFARDWANILNESTFSDDIEISYFFLDESNFKERIHRIEDADYVFYALGPDTGSIPQTILNSVPEKKLYIVGNKNFGSSNGIVYAQRYKDDYFDSAVHISEDIISHNAKYKELYNNHYIDLITPVQNTSDMIFVFTDTNHFISQDTLHLTKYGAQYYARILDFSWLIMD